MLVPTPLAAALGDGYGLGGGRGVVTSATEGSSVESLCCPR